MSTQRATRGGLCDPQMSHPTDHAKARKFAVEWATKDSSGNIANLARAYLREAEDLRKLYYATKALHASLGEYVRQSMHCTPEWRTRLETVEPLMVEIGRRFYRLEHPEEESGR